MKLIDLHRHEQTWREGRRDDTSSVESRGMVIVVGAVQASGLRVATDSCCPTAARHASLVTVIFTTRGHMV